MFLWLAQKRPKRWAIIVLLALRDWIQKNQTWGRGPINQVWPQSSIEKRKVSVNSWCIKEKMLIVQNISKALRKSYMNSQYPNNNISSQILYLCLKLKHLVFLGAPISFLPCTWELIVKKCTRPQVQYAFLTSVIIQYFGCANVIWGFLHIKS